MSKAHELADKIDEHEMVDDVRAEKNRIEVFETVDLGEEEMSEEILDYVKSVLEKSHFQPEVGGWMDKSSVSRHSKSGGMSNNPSLGGGEHQLRKSYVR